MSRDQPGADTEVVPAPHRTAQRAFIMVWDGMRPDLISPELTPNLVRLAADGIHFTNSHAVFPTVTRVNSASISTGTLPSSHGIVGNSLFAPLVDRQAVISIGDHRILYSLVESRGGRLLPCDTLADRLHAAGGRTVVVSTGSPGSAFLCHPRVRECAGDVLIHPVIPLPDGVLDDVVARFGPPPPDQSRPKTAFNAYFNRVLTDYVLPDLDPALLVYWHCDPDVSQHAHGFGSPEALAAIRDADDNLGRALAALARLERLDSTVVAVVSDHGYASLEPVVDPETPLLAGGLEAELRSGRVLLAKNGCALFAYVLDGEAELIQRVAEAFQRWEHGGPVFSGARGRLPLAGTLPLALVGCDGELAPDVLCALAWDDAPNQFGHGGRSAGVDAQYRASHGGISPWEIRNTLVMAGAGLKRGLVDPLPAGNLDLAPTLLHLLGLEPPPGQDGRVLREALVGGPDPAEFEVRPEQVSAERGGYRQSVRFSLVGATRYLESGRAERVPSGGLIELG